MEDDLENVSNQLKDLERTKKDLEKTVEELNALLSSNEVSSHVNLWKTQLDISTPRF